MRPATLKKNKEFGFVYRKGSPVHTRYFTLVCAKSRYGGIRAGFSVSKKVGNSVTRNKVRRRMKEAYRLMWPELSGNYGLVFVARPCIVDAPYREIAREMCRALQKLKIAGSGK